MSSTPAWSATELRALIAEVPHDRAVYGSWWSTPRGRTLAAGIGTRMAPTVRHGVRARTGRWVDPAEVIGLVVEALAPPSQLVRGLLAASTDDPVAYLGRSLVNALAREVGPDRSADLEALPRVAATMPDGAPIGLESAVGAVCRELAPHTPPQLRPTLHRAVERIVDCAADGSLSRLHTRAALDAQLLDLGWSAEQLRALVNAVIGARPDHARASLVAGFLTRADWRPRESPEHRAAIRSYARRMSTASTALQQRTQPAA